MYFSDLSCYSYNLPKSLPTVLNVGWLAKEHEFSTGKPSLQLLEPLKNWIRIASVNQMRGFHCCNFCNAKNERASFTRDGSVFLLGAAEIWIPSRKGVIFAAPDMIVHYIECHEYLPPKDFIEAANDTLLKERWNASAEFERLSAEAFRD